MGAGIRVGLVAFPTDSLDRFMKKSPMLWFLGCLLVVLGFLFRESLVPGMAAFANDAPLGLMQAYSDVRWDYFLSGSWLHNVWIGGPALSTLPNFSHGLYLLGGAIFFAKFAAVLSMAFAAVCLWFFCRRQGFNGVASALPGLAMALNGNLLSHATWGLGSRAATVGFAALALAAATPVAGRRGWRVLAQMALAGFATGMTVMEGADVGAFFSVLIAAYVVYNAWIEPSPWSQRLTRSAVQLGVVVFTAFWISALALTSLVWTQIKGVAGMSEDPAARDERWEFVTGWSFPKLEVVRLAIPGIMGVRSISPGEEMYWGNVGSDGSPPRFNGGSEYAGVLVLIVAGFALARSLARTGRQPYTRPERQRIWFWGGVTAVSLLLSFGHYGPLYRLVFALPYFSTIRIPMKWLHVTHLALLILFAYGLQGLWRLYVEVPESGSRGWTDRLRHWWQTSAGFEKAWAWSLVGLVGAAAAFALIYASYGPSLADYLGTLGFQGAAGKAMAAYSVHEVILFALWVAVCGLLLALIASGRFAGSWGGWAAALLGLVLVVDLGRAMSPYVLFFNYTRRYEPNAVTEFLRQKSWEHRVVARPHPQFRSTFSNPNDGNWPAVHNQWLENQFPFNQIQTLDIWQMPRQPELDKAMLTGFAPAADNLSLVGRLWDLTNVRYVLGARGIEAELDRLVGQGKPIFKPVMGFDLASKAGTKGNAVTLDDITAVPNSTGQYALFENTRALPRAAWFSRWETQTNDTAVLERLKDPAFDPAQTVVLSSPVSTAEPTTNAPAGQASILKWGPKGWVIETVAPTAGVLLLNDRWHPDWRVTVDGQPAELLRANLVMRAVQVPAGKHTVEFRYQPSMTMLWVTLSALVVALGLGVWLTVAGRSSKSGS